MTHIKGLDHLSFSTYSLEEIEEFYCGVLGLEISFTFRNDETGERYGFFIRTPNGTRLEFFYTPRPSVFLGRCRHIAFEVDDVEAQAVALRAAGYVPGPVKRGRKDGVLQFFVDDPQGNLIEFQQFDEQSIR